MRTSKPVTEIFRLDKRMGKRELYENIKVGNIVRDITVHRKVWKYVTDNTDVNL
jgi:hypothetical protein